TLIPCILQGYTPTGKVYDKIGSELHSLYYNFVSTNPNSSIYLIMTDSVYIEVISLIGQYQTLLNLLLSPPYGMTDTINNGPNTLIISGKYPIINLLKLDSLPTLIDYVRPLFPALSGSGITTTGGDIAQVSNFARNGFNVRGENVKVGVLSDSYNTILGNPAATDIANGDLPGAGNP